MAAVDRRKPFIFVAVLFAALITTVVVEHATGHYLGRSYVNSDCKGELLVERGRDRMADGLVKTHARNLQAALDKTEGAWRISVNAAGRALIHTYRFNNPVSNDEFYRKSGIMQKQLIADYCSQKYWKGREFKVTETHTVYSSEGERLISFSISPADCPQWFGITPSLSGEKNGRRSCLSAVLKQRRGSEGPPRCSPISGILPGD